MAIIFTSEEDFSLKSTEALKSIVLGEEVGLKFKLKEVMKDRGMTSRELARNIGVNESTISNYIHNKAMATLNIQHLLAIIIALRVIDLSELLEIDMSAATKQRWTNDLKLWKENGWKPVYRQQKQ